MPFRFRLQRVLGVRESVEKQRAQELARAAAEEQLASDAHDDAAARLEARRVATSLPEGRTLAAGMLHNLELTVHAASDEVTWTKAALEAAADDTLRTNARYLDARRDRRVLERLREERLHTWHESEVRRDRRAMDDIAQVQRRHKRAA